MSFRLINTTVAVLLFTSVCAPPASTASRNDAMKIVNAMEKHTCKHVISRKSYPGGGEQIVFVYEGKRYTLYWSESGNYKDDILSIWVRPNGTTSSAVLQSFSDHGLDGTVDVGLAGPAKWSDDRRKYYDRDSFEIGRRKGSKFQKHWQREYDAAIAAAKRRLL